MNATGTPLEDPRHFFLTAREVHARYRLGRTAGYKLTRSPGFPPPVVRGRWRLADLLAWEDQRAAATEVATPPHYEFCGPVPTLPAPRRRRAR